MADPTDLTKILEQPVGMGRPLWFLKPQGIAEFYKSPLGASVDYLSGGVARDMADQQAAAAAAAADGPMGPPMPPTPVSATPTAPMGPPVPQAPLKPITLRNTTVAKQITPGLYSPAEVAQFEGLAKERESKIHDATATRMEALDRSADVLLRQMAEQRTMNAQAGKRASAAFKQHEQVTQELQRMHLDLRSSKIDPNRLWDSMSAGRKAMKAISVAIGGFLEGWSGGKIKNAGLKMLDRAIDQDIAAQRADLQRKLQLVQLTTAQKNALWQQWRATEGDRKTGMLRLAQLQLAEAKVDSDIAEVQARADDLILGIKEKLVDIKAKSRDRVAKTIQSSSRQVMPKPAGVSIDKTTLRNLQTETKKIDAGIDLSKKLRRLLARAGSRPLIGTANSLAKDISDTIKDMALAHRTAMGDTGPVTDKDIPTYDRAGNKWYIQKGVLARRAAAYEANLRKARQRAIRSAFTSPQQFIQQLQPKAGPIKGMRSQ